MRIFDTLSGRKETFVLANNNSVRILICGPTVYDYSHVGHARMLLFYDLAARYFRSKGASVSVVVNITDIDPKVFKRAKQSGVPPQEIATRFIGELAADLSALGIDGFALARMSDHIGTAQSLAKELLRSGRAYPAGGNVYLDVAVAPSFGSMARMTCQDLSDCRLDISPAKKSPQDILLWNASENFDVSFSDPVLGTGIPWWHMQDSSVAVASFGGSYEMHGGASELVYPHHESHLAQLQAITSLDRPVRFWTHVGLVRTKGKKMSKSLGNTVRIRDLLRRHSANAIRLYLLSRHYRNVFDFSEQELERFEQICFKISAAPDSGGRQPRLAVKFFKCIEDDFDTPGAIKALTEAAKSGSAADLKAMVNILGLG